MSRIYDALKLLESERPQTTGRSGSRSTALERERRSSSRRVRRVPVFVYGRSRQGVPFHEETRMTCVNSGGGLTELATGVAPGQDLLLVNLSTQGERACRVVRIGSSSSERASIALAFSHAGPDFWK